jgi:hypothetical protein
VAGGAIGRDRNVLVAERSRFPCCGGVTARAVGVASRRNVTCFCRCKSVGSRCSVAGLAVSGASVVHCGRRPDRAYAMAIAANGTDHSQLMRFGTSLRQPGLRCGLGCHAVTAGKRTVAGGSDWRRGRSMIKFACRFPGGRGVAN